MAYRCPACLSKDPEHACRFKGVPGRDPSVPLGPPKRVADADLLTREQLLAHPEVGPRMRALALEEPEAPLFEQLVALSWEMSPEEREILRDVLERVEREHGER